ncbi:MAG: histidine phosphatase family protein [Desulfobacteraceae bacterium]|nr:histidine phosphatase family protein [Desulfobacteraceae bacterium]
MAKQQSADFSSRAIYLLRHAEPAAAPGGKRYIGWSDPPLSPAGIDQAEKWQPFFSAAELSAVFCSDLRRSRQTAELVAVNCPLQIHALPELREIHLGAWEGRTFEEVRREDPQGFEQRGQDPVGFRPPGGESFGDLGQRVVPIFQQILSDTSGNILIVGHAGVNRVLLCHVLGLPLAHLFRLEQNYAALNVITVEPIGFRLQALNRCLHRV